MQDLISVIIPLYNAEKHIQTCFDALNNQSYSNLEIIFINDGSTDNSLKILKEIEKHDSRVVLFSQENKGVSAARNKGLDAACGDYISFIDVDDIIEKDFFFNLLSEIKTTGADIVCCGYKEIAVDKYNNFTTSKIVSYEGEMKKESKECFNDHVSNFFYTTVIWGKLFISSYAKSVRYENVRYAEDMWYMMKIFSQKPDVYMSTYVGYSYIKWPDSATNNPKILDRRYESSLVNMFILREYIFPNAYGDAAGRACERYIMHSVNLLTSAAMLDKKTAFGEHKQDDYFQQLYHKYNGCLGIQWKIILHMYWLCPKICWLFLKTFYIAKSIIKSK